MSAMSLHAVCLSVWHTAPQHLASDMLVLMSRMKWRHLQGVGMWSSEGLQAAAPPSHPQLVAPLRSAPSVRQLQSYLLGRIKARSFQPCLSSASGQRFWLCMLLTQPACLSVCLSVCYLLQPFSCPACAQQHVTKQARHDHSAQHSSPQASLRLTCEAQESLRLLVS